MEHQFDHLALLTDEQRQALQAFYAETPALIETSHHQTTNGIFVTIHQEYSPEMSIDPAYHTVATCRKVGGVMLREVCDIKDVRFTPHLDGGHHSLEKVMSIMGRETNRHAIIRLGKSSLWVEQDAEGYTAHYPLIPFNPAVLTKE